MVLYLPNVIRIREKISTPFHIVWLIERLVYIREQTNKNNMNLHVLNNNGVRFVEFHPNISFFVPWHFLRMCRLSSRQISVQMKSKKRTRVPTHPHRDRGRDVSRSEVKAID